MTTYAIETRHGHPVEVTVTATTVTATGYTRQTCDGWSLPDGNQLRGAVRRVIGEGPSLRLLSESGANRPNGGSTVTRVYSISGEPSERLAKYLTKHGLAERA